MSYYSNVLFGYYEKDLEEEYNERMGNKMRYKDLTGKKFGKLTAVKYVYTKNGYACWECICECGNKTISPSCDLTRGFTKTCGKCSKRISNNIDILDDYAEMTVKTKEETLKVKISLEDVERVKKGRWWATKKGKNWYFYSDRLDGHKKISLHRYIMNCPKGLVVDHINTYDHLDNRRSNLRICTKQENSQNQRISETNTTGIQNITWDNTRKKWRFTKQINGQIIDKLSENLEELLELKEKITKELNNEYSH